MYMFREDDETSPSNGTRDSSRDRAPVSRGNDVRKSCDDVTRRHR